MTEGAPVDHCSQEHGTRRKESGQPDATTVQDNAAEEEHQQKDVEDGIAAYIKAILGGAPSQSAFSGRRH